MNQQNFFLSLAATTLLSIVLVLGLNFFPKIAAANVLSWSTVGTFAVFSIVVFFFSNYTAKSQSKNLFTNVIIMAMMFRMIICILIVGIYVKTAEPSNNFFLVPFFSIYVIYTIFEVHFMTRLGKND